MCLLAANCSKKCYTSRSKMLYVLNRECTIILLLLLSFDEFLGWNQNFNCYRSVEMAWIAQNWPSTIFPILILDFDTATTWNQFRWIRTFGIHLPSAGLARKTQSGITYNSFVKKRSIENRTNSPYDQFDTAFSARYISFFAFLKQNSVDDCQRLREREIERESEFLEPVQKI